MKQVNFNALDYALEGAAGTGGAIGGGYLAIKAGQGLLKRKLDRDGKYDGMSTDLDYQSNTREANAIQDPSERNATLTKLRRDYDDRKWQLDARQRASETGGKVALGGLGAAAGYGIGKNLIGHGASAIQEYRPSLGDAVNQNLIGGVFNNFSKADFANPIHGLLAKTGAAAGALSGYQDADKKYWEGRKEIEYISDPEERANRLRDYDSFNSKLGRAGNTLKTSAIRAGIGAGIGYVGSKTAGHLFADRPQPQPTTTNMNKKIRKSANFALPNLNLHPNVNLGAKIGAGLGLASGLGIGESDRERENTDIGGRLGKIVGKTAIGGGLGAAAGYGYNKYQDTKILNNADVAVKNNVAPPAPDKSIQQARADAQAPKWKAYENRPPQPQEVPQPSRWSRVKNYLNKDVKEVGQDIRQVIRNTTGFEKTIRKSANFQDPATIQRLIQKGSTFIPQDTTGVVSLEATLRGKMQKKKLREPKVPASMGVEEINKMIESGKPVGKYFSKSVRKSVTFAARKSSTAEFIQLRDKGFLEQAGRIITEPVGKYLEQAGTNTKGGLLGGWGKQIAQHIPNKFGQEQKWKLGLGNNLQGLGSAIRSKKGAERVAIGTGIVGGAGLLAAGMALSKRPKPIEEERPL